MEYVRKQMHGPRKREEGKWEGKKKKTAAGVLSVLLKNWTHLSGMLGFPCGSAGKEST